MSRSKSTNPMNISGLDLLFKKNELTIPGVQRELVWTKSQKQLLIDSIMKEYDIPKIYLRKTINEEGKKVYEIYDGQQRLFAIFDFMRDKFALRDDTDDFEGEKVAGKTWSQLSSDSQIMFTNRSLDITILEDYTDEEVEEMFLRLQNGTPLKAAEKRRAVPGNMRDIVSELAKHDVFSLCYFKNTHYAFEDSVTKILKQIAAGEPTTITYVALENFYKANPNIKETDKEPTAVKRAFNFLCKAFKNTPNPKLKKYALLDLTVIASSMLNTYDLSKYAEQFGNAYLSFRDARVLNEEKPEEEQDPRLAEYGNATRGDGIGMIKYRQDLLREYILQQMPFLIVKDSRREFTPDQRAVIYRIGNGICASCGKKVSEDDFEADHVIAWSNGGPTQISNGQVLCSTCNKKKSDKNDTGEKEVSYATVSDATSISSGPSK